MKQIKVRIIFLVFSTLLAAALSFAGTKEAEKPPALTPSQPEKELSDKVAAALGREKLPDKVAALGELRRKLLLRDKPKTEQELADLRRKSDEKQFLSVDLARALRDLDFVKKERDNVSRLRSIEEFVQRVKERLKPLANIDFADQIKKKETELSNIENSLADIERTIDKLLDPEVAKRRFKLIMSSVFAGLVAFVIGGFFYVARIDEKVRQAMFSGQAGIQFVTLFSLVIAIILFGILEILEGKELAALLGGLSGYILGRTTGGMTTQQSGSNAPKP